MTEFDCGDHLLDDIQQVVLSALSDLASGEPGRRVSQEQ